VLAINLPCLITVILDGKFSIYCEIKIEKWELPNF
jgi:hypothetical protein